MSKKSKKNVNKCNKSIMTLDLLNVSLSEAKIRNSYGNLKRRKKSHDSKKKNKAIKNFIDNKLITFEDINFYTFNEKGHINKIDIDPRKSYIDISLPNVYKLKVDDKEISAPVNVYNEDNNKNIYYRIQFGSFLSSLKNFDKNFIDPKPLTNNNSIQLLNTSNENAEYIDIEDVLREESFTAHMIDKNGNRICNFS